MRTAAIVGHDMMFTFENVARHATKSTGKPAGLELGADVTVASPPLREKACT